MSICASLVVPAPKCGGGTTEVQLASKNSVVLQSAVGRAPRFPPPDLGIGIVTAPALACGVVVQDTAIIVEK